MCVGTTKIKTEWKTSSAAEEDGSTERIPIALRPLVSAYRSVPRFSIPLTDFDVSFILASFAALCPLRVAFENLLPLAGWPPSDTRLTIDAAGSFVSGLQATFLCVACWSCLVSQPYRPSSRIDSAPVWWRDAVTSVLDYCIGYMMYDTVFLIITAARTGTDLGGDIMFLGHHFATSLTMLSARRLGAGHLVVMILMFTGELSSPFMNSHMVLRLAARVPELASPWLHTMLAYAEFSYSIVYVAMRIFLGPISAAHITYELIFTKRGRENVPFWLTALWLPMIWGVLIGSKPYIDEALEMLSDGLWQVKYGPDYDMGDLYVLRDEL